MVGQKNNGSNGSSSTKSSFTPTVSLPVSGGEQVLPKERVVMWTIEKYFAEWKTPMRSVENSFPDSTKGNQDGSSSIHAGGEQQ